MLPAMTTLPSTNHHWRATHQYATQAAPVLLARTAPPFQGPRPGEHSAPVKPPEMNSGLRASSLVLALFLPQPAPLVRSVTTNPPQSPSQNLARGWIQGPAGPPHRGLVAVHPAAQSVHWWYQPTPSRQESTAGHTPPRDPHFQACAAPRPDAKSDFRLPSTRDTGVSRGIALV